MNAAQTDTAQTDTVQTDTDELLIGYGPVAKYLGLQKGTLSTYMSRGYGPSPEPKRVQRGQYNLYAFRKSVLDHWKANRPGAGARTDRQHTGLGRECGPCAGACTVEIT
jgi:hypothetical protein